MQTSARRQPQPGGPAFVHDFATVHMPVEQVVAAFAARAHPAALAPMVLHAWDVDTELLVAAGLGERDAIAATSVHVELNLRRSRTNATIVNVKWRGNGWLPVRSARAR